MKILLAVALTIFSLDAALAESLPGNESAAESKTNEVLQTESMPAVPEGGAVPKESEPVPREVVVVEGKSEPEKISDAYIVPKDRQPNTERTISKQGINLFATPGQTNPLLGINMLPSVNIQTADPYGLGPQTSVNIRGKTSFHLARTVEDLPINGVVGGAELFDLENINNMTLYSGAVPVDHGFAPSNATGNLNLSILRPNDNFGITYRQSNGSFQFNRSYGRIDTGLLPTKTKFFFSYSFSDAHKWKGEGDAPVGRLNGEFGMVQEFGQHVKLEVFGVTQSYKSNIFRSLTYAQIGNLPANRGLDFNRGITGIQSQDINFYNFNTQQYNNTTIFANLEVRPTATSKFMLKPYFWNNNGYTLTGGTVLGQPGVTRWDQNNQNYGLVAQYDAQFWGLEGTVGYWYDNMEAPPPPVDMRAFFPQPNGQLAFGGYSLLTKQDSHVFHAPYIAVKKKTDRLEATVGMKYLYQIRPTYQGYNTAGVPNIPYGYVFNANPQPNPNLLTPGTTFQELLPYLGTSYLFTDNLAGRFVYGRNYGRPDWGPPISTYSSNQATFQKAGLTLNDIINPLRPQITDNFDLGVRYNQRQWYLAPTLFYTRVRNQEVFAFDPNVGLQYAQPNGKARSYGAEMEVGAQPLSVLSVYATASYMKYEFEDDVRTATNATLPITGKQVPDAPRWMAKLGATYEEHGFVVSPLVRWLGSRYADAQNTQKVSDYYLVDANIGYKVPPKYSFGLKDLQITGTFLNIFDRKYVGIISFNELQLNGATAFFAGTPFTAVVGLRASMF